MDGGVVLARTVGERRQRHGEPGIHHGLQRGLELLPQLFLGREVLEIEDGIAGLPERQRNAGCERPPQQHRPGGLAGQLLDCPAHIGLALAAHGETDRHQPDQEMQDAAHGKPGPGHQLKCPGVGDVLGGVGGALQFSFDVRSLNCLGCSAESIPARRMRLP